MMTIRMALRGAIMLGTLTTSIAAEVDFSIIDYSGCGFAPDLVQYSVHGAKVGEALTLTDGNGTAIPVQFTAGTDDASATLHFVAEVGPNATATYHLSDKGSTSTPSRLTVRTNKKVIEVGNGLLSVRLPGVQEEHYPEGMEASKLPAPVLAFQSGTSPWLGESRILTGRKVKAFRVSLIAEGPVYAEVLYEIEWLEGGFYRARLQVIDRVPIVKIIEDFDLGKLDGTDFWELQLIKGWQPDTMETARIYANGGGIDKGSNKPLATLAEMNNPRILPDNICFSISYLGIFSKDGPDTPIGPMAGITLRWEPTLPLPTPTHSWGVRICPPGCARKSASVWPSSCTSSRSRTSSVTAMGPTRAIQTWEPAATAAG